jgi:molybdenum cofactor cytidylyltransferase
MIAPHEAGLTPRRHVVLLCAGGSRRLGRPKALIRLGDAPLVRIMARRSMAASSGVCIVVLGAARGRIAAALQGLPVQLVINKHWRIGQGSSVARGIRALPRSASHALVLAVDQWRIDERSLRHFLRSARYRPLAARYSGRVGIPVVFPRSWFKRLSALSGERGAQALLDSSALQIRELPEAAWDIDVASDVAPARRRGWAARRER